MTTRRIMLARLGQAGAMVSLPGLLLAACGEQTPAASPTKAPEAPKGETAKPVAVACCGTENTWVVPRSRWRVPPLGGVFRPGRPSLPYSTSHFGTEFRGPHRGGCSR
ncbi:MAG: hypothetical protein EBZ89_15925 [Chloroflexi bacterium]|nr:hypothetical protein [Chloroflexota bacterium]